MKLRPNFFIFLTVCALAAYGCSSDTKDGIDSSRWSQSASLKASNVAAPFGHSMALSNDTIVVGDWGEQSSQTTITNDDGVASTDNSLQESGAAYVFKKDANGSWIQDAYIKASNTDMLDRFGYSTAISNDVIVIGAYDEDSGQTTISNDDGEADADNSAISSGAAYVFKKDANGNWIQDAYLKASNAESEDNFAYSVAICNDTIVIGAIGEDSGQTTITNSEGTAGSDNSANGSGAVYVFKKDTGGNWIQAAYIKASNAEGIQWGKSAYNSIGYSVAISNDIIVAGAYNEDSNQTTITNEDGVASADYSLQESGAAYVFKKGAGGSWVQDAYLKASNADMFDYFGYSVAISDGIIVVGAYNEDSGQTTIINIDGAASSDNSGEDYGAAYVFKKNTNGNWIQDAYLKASEEKCNFGYSVAIAGDIIAVGTYSLPGTVYVFMKDASGNWVQDASLKVFDDTYNNFGFSLAVDDGIIAVGASSLKSVFLYTAK